jgi:hypothetical protein
MDTELSSYLISHGEIQRIDIIRFAKDKSSMLSRKRSPRAGKRERVVTLMKEIMDSNVDEV